MSQRDSDEDQSGTKTFMGYLTYIDTLRQVHAFGMWCDGKCIVEQPILQNHRTIYLTTLLRPIDAS